MYNYKCEKCNKEKFYKSLKAFEKALKFPTCYLCRFKENNSNKTRNCPECNTVVVYKNYSAWIQANIRNSKCSSCDVERLKGDRNPFFGKTHSEESKKKISIANTGRKDSEETKEKKRQYALKHKNGGDNYKFWLDKFGKDIADEKLKVKKQKLSITSQGSKNRMFGKPSPKGAGNGWSGWYKKWFFRSLLELSYMIQIIEAQNLKWKSGENSKYRVQYIDYKGQVRNYFPDFIIEDKIVVEVKPLKLLNSPSVKAKAEAALLHFSSLNMEYRLESIDKISSDEIKHLYNIGAIKFTQRTEEKYKEFYAQ